jgi:hypothetical protein
MDNVLERGSRRCVDRRPLIRLFIGAAVVFSRPLHAQTRELAGAVEDVKGDAFAEANDQRRILDRSAAVFVKDIVATGADARLAIHLGTDTTLRMGQSARVTIDRFLINAGGDITLQTGPILFERPEGAPALPMQIHSAFGLIAVRGTRFFAGPSAGVFGVFVERGSVAVTGAGTQVVVEAGQGTNIARPGDAPTPPAPWGGARIATAMQSVQ